MKRHSLLCFIALCLCIGCKNASNGNPNNKTVDESSYEFFELHRNFNGKSIAIQGLPEKDEQFPQVFDVIKVSSERMTQLDTSIGNKMGRLLMPNLWDKTQYYCSGRLRLVNGVDSFVIYVPNYRETRSPYCCLVNIKENRLIALLSLSFYNVGGADYAHLYTQYTDGIFTAYYKNIEIEEMTAIEDNHRDETLRESLASFVFNPESYSAIRQTIIDKDGFFHEIGQ